MYSMEEVVNNTVLHILKFLKKVDLKTSHNKKKIVTICNEGC